MIDVASKVERGRLLKEQRERRGYSQAELAAALGVHIMSVSKWERGLHRIPETVTLVLSQLRPKVKKKTKKAA